MTDQSNKQGGKFSLTGGNKTLKIFLIVSAGVLVTALAVVAVLLLGGGPVDENRIERVMEYNTVLKGVSVGGVDISGMTADEAYAATAHVEKEALSRATITLDLDGEILTYDASVFGFVTDYEEMMRQAIAYGHTGSFEDRKAAAETAREVGVNFEVDVKADKSKVLAALNTMNDTLNAEARDASVVFMPNGYFADGTPYDPDAWDEAKQGPPPLVMLPENERPNPLRYLFWDNDHYVKDYIPKDAYIARFLYIPEQKGFKTDLGKLADMIVSAVNTDDTSAVVVPTEVTEPAVTLEQVKAQTQLISSWTSSYSRHSSSNRVHNVSKLSGIINGQVLEPGVVWSINETAGPRTVERGWKAAAGIKNGAFVPDPGGGVCQISSTLYNAALRSGLNIVESKHHSIISDYIPIGLDATISTNSPDLKLKNENSTPMYIVSYMNRSEKNVTVEIYGPPVVHPEYGEVILHYTSKKTSTGKVPETITYYNQTKTPDGDAIPPGKAVTYVQARASTTATVYIHYYKLDGTLIKTEKFYTHKYPAITGKVYVNGPDPSTIPTPAPSPPQNPPTEPTQPANPPEGEVGGETGGETEG
ncbi:MAG: VanW family protein [Christensenellales bacterium]|jgi:vancomycin resistance protein YoaR